MYSCYLKIFLLSLLLSFSYSQNLRAEDIQKGFSFLKSFFEDDAVPEQNRNSSKFSKGIFEGQTCKILVLEGGGDNGAYQAGAMKGLFENISKEEAKYDIITGVSLGAFNAAILASYPLGEEQKAADEISTRWHNANKSNIYKNWPLGIVQGIFFKEGFYNSSPSEEFMTKIFKDRTINRHLIIGTVNAVTSDHEYFDNEHYEKFGVAGAILASSAYPPLFPSYKYMGNHYYDGTIKHSVEFVSAVNLCMEKGYKKEDIVIDALLCNSNHLSTFNKENFHPLDSLMRLIEILSYDNAEFDKESFKRLFPEVQLRHVISPSKELPKDLHPYEFKDSDIHIMLEMGYQDALNELKPKEETS